MKADHTFATVVLVGDFAPAKLTLEELKKGGVLSKPDLDDATYHGLLKDEVVDIAFGSWGRITALKKTVSIQINEAPFIRGADLALRCIRELAPTSTIQMLGINVTSFYKFTDLNVRDKVGRALAPPSNWGVWGKEIEDSQSSYSPSDSRHGGLIKISMRQGVTDDRPAGYIDVHLESAVRQQNEKTDIGIQIMVNDHYQVNQEGENGEDSSRVVTAKLLDILEANFDTSIERAITISNDVISSNIK